MASGALQCIFQYRGAPMQSPFFVFLDDARQQTGALYENLVHMDTFSANQLKDLGEQASSKSMHHTLQENWQKQWHAVVWAPYGLGRELMELDPCCEPNHEGVSETAPDSANKEGHNNGLVIYWFADKTTLRDEASIQAWLASHQVQQEPAGLSHLELEQERASYIQTIEQIRDNIAAGDMYQINYTTQFTFQAYGSPYKLYQKIRQQQRVPYGALAHLPDVQQSTSSTLETRKAQWTLCFSPELFLDIRQDGTIHTEPMKGTVPTANDGRNEERAEALRNDPKNRAENLMIVDLLRNDLSKIAQANGVSVPELFKVTNFGSVLQMTTHIQATAQTGTQAQDIFHALFPCGSITGAPKKKSMQLIDNYETRPRGLYTGSIGYLAPCDSGLGFYGQLNVVIRTLELSPAAPTPLPSASAPNQFKGKMGVGSGIIYDSIAEQEYEECFWKARFLRNLPLDFSLFETMRLEIVAGVAECRLLEQHLKRLHHSANDLGFKFNEDEIRQSILSYIDQLVREHARQDQGAEHTRQINLALQINETSSHHHNSTIAASDPASPTYRLKAMLQGDGSLRLQSARLEPLTPSERTLIIAESRLANQDLLRRYKTTHRHTYDHEMQRAITQGAFDSLCFNQDGHLLEGARSSIFAYIDGQWHTPSLTLDILQSVMRAEIMQKPEQWLRAYTPVSSTITDSTTGAASTASPVPPASTISAAPPSSRPTTSLSVLESQLTLEQIRQADCILAVNALRGVVPVNIVPDTLTT